MIGSKLTLTARIQIALGLTSGVMLVAFAGLGLYGWLKFGGRGIVAAAVACGLCWMSGVIALSVNMLFRAPHQAVPGVLLGMLFRMGLPLAAGLILLISQSVLLQAGVIGMLIGAYLLGLFIETLCAWWIVESVSGTSAPGAAKAT